MTLSPGIFTTILFTGCLRCVTRVTGTAMSCDSGMNVPAQTGNRLFSKPPGTRGTKQGRYGSMLGKPLGDFASSAETVARETELADLTNSQEFPLHWGPMREAKVFCMANRLSRQ